MKDVAVRAFKTFWQASLASLMLGIQPILNSVQSGVYDFNTLKPLLVSLAIGAISAGLSAVYNGFFRKSDDNDTGNSSGNT